MNSSKETILISGYGYFESFIGESLRGAFKEVIIFSPIQSNFPTPEKDHIGDVPGITRAENYEDSLERATVVALFDLGDVSKAKQAQRMGKAVICVGEGEELEINRKKFKQTLLNVGLEKDATHWKFVYGIDALAHELKTKKVKKVWVKWSPKARGLGETFDCEDYELCKSDVDEIAFRLGIDRDTWEFLVEENYDGVEPGSDIWVCDGVPLGYGLYGWELKDKFYLGKFIALSDFPGPVKKVHDAMAPVWKSYKVNGPISCEMRVGKDRWPHYTDATMRMACPPGQLIAGGYKNTPEIINAIAHRQRVKPEFRGKYGAEFAINCPGSDEKAVPIKYNPERIKVHRPCKFGNRFFAIPDKDSGTCIAHAIGWGDTPEEATFLAQEAAEEFDCPGKEYDKTAPEELMDQIREGEKFGLGVF